MSLVFCSDSRKIYKTINQNADYIALAMIQSVYPLANTTMKVKKFLKCANEIELKSHFTYVCGKKEDIYSFIKHTPMNMPMYELFYDDMPVRPYFDIDKTTYSRLKILCDFIILVYRAVYNLSENELNESHLIICAREQDPECVSKQCKDNDNIFLSAHIIINNGMYHNTLVEIQQIVLTINSYIIRYYGMVDPSLCMIDSQVYKNAQLMRLPFKTEKVTDTRNTCLYLFTYTQFFNNESSCSTVELREYIISRPDGHAFKMKSTNGHNYTIEMVHSISDEFYEYITSKMKDMRFMYNEKDELSTLCYMLKQFEDSFRMRLFIHSLVIQHKKKFVDINLVNDGITTKNGDYECERKFIWDKVYVPQHDKITNEKEMRRVFDFYYSNLQNRMYKPIGSNKMSYILRLKDVKMSLYTPWAHTAIIGNPSSTDHVNCFFKIINLDPDSKDLVCEFRSAVPFTLSVNGVSHDNENARTSHNYIQYQYDDGTCYKDEYNFVFEFVTPSEMPLTTDWVTFDY
jgi:hypothetical protein